MLSPKLTATCLLATVASLALTACLDETHASSSTHELARASEDGPDAGTGAVAAGSGELPPLESADAIEQWLATGAYKRWACEGAPHASRPPSGHSPNRVCSNALASGHGAGEYPVGAASVKELYDEGSTRIVGYAVARKVAAGGGEAWHWFERLEGAGVIANGLGTDGTAKRVCARCHARAGAATFGHHDVFTQVP